jgi:hypothetical protein
MFRNSARFNLNRITWSAIFVINFVGLILIYSELPSKISRHFSHSLCTTIPLKRALTAAIEPQFWYLHIGIIFSVVVLLKVLEKHEVLLKLKKIQYLKMAPSILIAVILFVTLLIARECGI